MKEFYVLVDDHENLPIPIPDRLVIQGNRGPETVRLNTIKKRMPFGDYAIENQEHLLCIERKRDIREIAQNCMSADKPRFLRALDKLASGTQRPYLIVEGTPSQLLTPTSQVREPSLALSILLRELSARNITPLFLPAMTIKARRDFGEYIAHMMIAVALTPPSGDLSQQTTEAGHTIQPESVEAASL